MRSAAVATLLTTLCAVLLAAGAASAGVEELTVGGRFMWDQVVWGDVDDELGVDPENGTEVRRARIFMKGKVYSNLKFKVNWDFAKGEEVSLKDAYLELTGLPAGLSLRAGHMLEPFCMNELTSSKYIGFVERASLTAFAPSRNSGVMATGRAGDRALLQAGTFRTTDGFGQASGHDGVAFAARAAVMVAGEEKSERLLHLGAAVNHLTPEDGSVRFRARPEVHMSDRFVDTGGLTADGVLRMGGEAAAVFGPLHFSAEYAVANVDAGETAETGRGEGEDASFSGFYAQAGYFITGEHRPFARGQWQRVKPATNFLEDGGPGAWEVAIRYSTLDLNDRDAGIEGGRMDNITAGLNWYMHSNARIMLNQVWSTVKDADDDDVGSAGATVMRVQFDF